MYLKELLIFTGSGDGDVLERPPGIGCFAILNKKIGQAITNIGGKVRLMKWRQKNDQAWYWSGKAIVSNSDNKYLTRQGTDGTDGILKAAPKATHLENQEWNVKRASDLYSQYIMAKDSNFFMDVKSRKAYGSTIGVASSRRRQDTSVWIFERFHCSEMEYGGSMRAFENSEPSPGSVSYGLVNLQSGQSIFSISNGANEDALTVLGEGDDMKVVIIDFQNSDNQKWFLLDNHIVSYKHRLVLEGTQVNEKVVMAPYNPNEDKQKWKLQEISDGNDDLDSREIILEFNNLRLSTIENPFGNPETDIGLKVRETPIERVTQKWWFKVLRVVE